MCFSHVPELNIRLSRWASAEFRGIARGSHDSAELSMFTPRETVRSFEDAGKPKLGDVNYV